MASEKQLWSWLSKARIEMRERLDLRRVEDMMGAGFPDVDGFAILGETNAETMAFKLELKSEERPARATTRIPFKIKKRVAQIEFMRKRYTMGENAYFLLQVGDASDARRYLAPGTIGAALLKGVTESELAIKCATENGYVFGPSVKPHHVIEGIRKCYLRRFFR